MIKNNNNFSSKKRTQEAQEKNPCETYRIELEPFVDSVITVECKNFDYFPIKIYGKNYTKVLLKNTNVIKVPFKLRDNKLPEINHMWVILDEQIFHKTEHKTIIIKGFVNTYKTKYGKKNIGLTPIAYEIK